MKKKYLLLLIAGFALSGCQETININDVYNPDGYTMKELEAENITVSFYYNFGKEEMNLNSGMYATGSSTSLKVDSIAKNSKVSRPERDPLRVNYEFAGWHTKADEDSPFDFNTNLIRNTILYAHWNKTQEDEFVEPEYVEPSHIDDSIDTLVSITGVLNMPISGTSVTVANGSKSRLNRSKEDVVDCLNYKIKSGVTLTASFDGTSVISYSATDGENVQNGSISVSTNNFNGGNSTYDTKAKNYEEKDVEFLDHRIMLAGSSSMENWKNSSEDLKPMITYNHGIGGTTVGEWKNAYNARLVYPYSPKIVVYYVGVNDLKDSGDGDVTGASLQAMFDDVHAHLPNTQIYYVLINKLPGFLNRQAEFEKCNNKALEYAESHSYVTCINAGKDLVKENGDPNQAFFLMDGIHMSLAGYAIWGQVIKSTLIADFKKNA